ncbi:restriction endonuclease subunit S [Micromonospora phytophila]|uniref:restriction endonuclease subunit S n=1 Tax=Micromonospora phytophila TaxID=709888 RepID=UPI002030AF4F|nr:restriction endonuclease subunit S [Micromonospora phytophila]MCM0674665.1 restriction endonuclease subunit S [Micromonospora phytophila]
MSDWQQITLDDLLTRVRRKVVVEDGVTYPAVSVQMYGRGLGGKEPFVGGASKYTTLNTVRENDVVLRTITAFEAPAGVARAEHDGTHVSGVFITYEVDQRVLPDFLGLTFQTPAFWDEMRNRASGTVLRRKTISDDSFRAIPFALPPLPTQERIVEVIGAVDDQITALDGEAKAAEVAAGAIAESMLANHAYVRVGNHLHRIEGGRSPRAIDKPPTEDEEGVLKVSAVAAFHFIADESKTLAPGTEMPDSAGVQAGDVLVTRASGAIHRVGAVCRVPSDVRGGLYLSDKTLRMVPADGLDPDFLVVAMALSAARRQITMAASGSASMKNISQSKIAGLEVPMPELTEQRKVASTVLSMRALGGTCRAEADRLRQVRAALLSGLLDGTIDLESADLGV